MLHPAPSIEVHQTPNHHLTGTNLSFWFRTPNMLAKARQIPYGAWIAAGWTDADLRAHGFMK